MICVNTYLSSVCLFNNVYCTSEYVYVNRTWYVCEHILLITFLHIHQCVYVHDIHRYEHDTHIRVHIYCTYIYKHTHTYMNFFWFCMTQPKIQQVLWLFHDNGNKRLAPLVHPPRLDGGKKGIFATRTPHRPNPIGLFCSCLPFRFSFWIFRLPNTHIHLQSEYFLSLNVFAYIYL